MLLRYRPGEVAYQSATPAPGFQVEVEKQGPPEVKVEFESESHKVDIEAAWDGQRPESERLGRRRGLSLYSFRFLEAPLRRP